MKNSAFISGNNVLAASGLTLITGGSMVDAAQRVVRAVGR